MVLTTVTEKVFIVENYFRSYGVGREGGLSLSQTALRFQEHFHKNPSRIALTVVENFEDHVVFLHSKRLSQVAQLLSVQTTEECCSKFYSH